MTTITDRDALRLPNSATARFIGEEHGAGVSFFWVSTPAGGGTDLHHHPYTETWVVQAGRASITAGDEQHDVAAGDIVTVSAGDRHAFRSLGPEPLDMICIHASPCIVQSFDTVDDGEPAEVGWPS